MNLVTGATGLVGSHLTYLLIKNGEAVKAIYRNEASIGKTRKVFKSYGHEKWIDQILWVEADLTDYFSLKDVFQGITNVYHCGAIVSFDRRKVHHMHETNIEGTRHLIDLSLENKIAKFCFVSSVASLGKYANGKCTDENALWAFSKSTSDYSISKFYAENEVWRGAEEGLKIVVVNPATILGFGDWNESSTAIFKKINDGLNYYTPGSNGFVGVKDVVKCMYYLMQKNAFNQRYILVSANWTFKQLLHEIARGLKKEPPKKVAPRFLANLLRRLDEIKYFLFGSPSVLTKQSINTAYNSTCYTSAKIIEEFNFEFEPLSQVIAETTAQYLSSD